MQSALANWANSVLFTDDHVRQVKTLFRDVFGLPDDTSLAGSVVPDAIILQSTQASRFYVLMQGDSDSTTITRDSNSDKNGAWTAMELDTGDPDTTMVFAKTTPFKDLLACLAESSHGLVCVSRRWPSYKK